MKKIEVPPLGGIKRLIFKSNFFKKLPKIYFKTIKNLKIISNTMFFPNHRKVTFQLSWELFKHSVRGTGVREDVVFITWFALIIIMMSGGKDERSPRSSSKSNQKESEKWKSRTCKKV